MLRLVSLIVFTLCLVTHADNDQDSAAKDSAAHVAHHGASSAAAQAISASQQAALMYQLLLTKGVMDYFQRKELEKANQVLSRKMEKLQQDLQAGKLSSAQYAAIKSAIEDTYAKYSKIEIPKDKEIQPMPSGGEKSLKSNLPDFSSGNLVTKKEDAEKLKSELQKTDLAQLDSNQPGLKTQGGGQEPDKKAPSKGDLEKPSASANGLGLLGQGLVFSSGVQTPPSQNLSIQNSLSNEPGARIQPENSASFRGPASAELGGTGFQVIPGSTEEETSASEFMDSEDGHEEGNLAQASLASRAVSSSSQEGLSFRSLFKPIRFQKNPFSTKLKTEEGLHLGLFLLVIGVAFVLGKKLNMSKRLPKVIPEVIPSSDKTVRSYSKAVIVQPRNRQRRRSPRT